MLKTKLNEICSGKESFFKDSHKQKIDSLFKNLESSKKLEDLIFKTLTKVDSLKKNHEDSAAVFVKLNELNENQEKLQNTIESDTEILNNFKEGVLENNNMIKKNIETIRARLNKLKKK